MIHVANGEMIIAAWMPRAKSQRQRTISKAAIATCAPVFSTRRMVKEYATRLYLGVPTLP